MTFLFLFSLSRFFYSLFPRHPEDKLFESFLSCLPRTYTELLISPAIQTISLTWKYLSPGNNYSKQFPLMGLNWQHDWLPNIKPPLPHLRSELWVTSCYMWLRAEASGRCSISQTLFCETWVLGDSHRYSKNDFLYWISIANNILYSPLEIPKKH